MSGYGWVDIEVMGYAPDWVEGAGEGYFVHMPNWIPINDGSFQRMAPYQAVPYTTVDTAGVHLPTASRMSMAFFFNDSTSSGTAFAFASQVAAGCNIYRLRSGVWSNVMGTSFGINYGGWNFANLGADYVGAYWPQVSETPVPMQWGTAAATTWAACPGGAPTAIVVVSAARFILAAGGTGGARWYCSARDNAQSWTASAATLANNGLLPELPGTITAMIAFGDDVILFKSDSVYRGVFVGAPEVWQWTKLDVEDGCITPFSVVDCGQNQIAFMGKQNVWLYDGVQFTPLLDSRAAASYAQYTPDGIFQAPSTLSLGYDAYYNCLGIPYYMLTETDSAGTKTLAYGWTVLLVNLASRRLGEFDTKVKYYETNHNGVFSVRIFGRPTRFGFFDYGTTTVTRLWSQPYGGDVYAANQTAYAYATLGTRSLSFITTPWGLDYETTEVTRMAVDFRTDKASSGLEADTFEVATVYVRGPKIGTENYFDIKFSDNETANAFNWMKTFDTVNTQHTGPELRFAAQKYFMDARLRFNDNAKEESRLYRIRLWARRAKGRT